MKNRFFALLLASSILVNSSPALAETGVILGENATKEDLEELIQGISLTGKRGVEVIITEEREGSPTLARNYYEKGVELFDLMKFSEAEENLKSSAKEILKQLPLPGNWQLLQSALFYLGAIYLLTERHKLAEKAFTRLLSINEEFEPDRTRFPPRILNGFNEAKGKFVPPRGYNVLICSEFDQVRLDDKVDIKTPLRIEMRQGKHIVQNPAKGYFATFEIKNNAIIFAGRINMKSEGDLRRILSLCGLDELLMIERKGTELSVQTLRHEEIQKSSTTQTITTEVAEKPFYKRWWFWTGVGVVAGGGATILFITDNNRDKGEPSSVVVKW